MGRKKKDEERERPGVIFYFDKFEPIRDTLSYEDKGRLMQAMLDYGQYGVMPEFDGVLKMIWGYIQPGIDADGMRFRERVVKSCYASYCSKEKRAGREASIKEFDAWLESLGIDTEGNQLVPPGTEYNHTVPGGTDSYPNIELDPKTNLNINPTLKPTPNIKLNINTAEKGEGEGAGEEKTGPNDFNAKRNAAIKKLSNYPG